MVVDDPRRLEVGVDDNGAHESHPPSLQVPGNCVGQGRRCPEEPVPVDHLLPPGEVPEIVGKAAELLLDR